MVPRSERLKSVYRERIEEFMGNEEWRFGGICG